MAARLQSTGAITSWLPLFLFVVLFGLSMDYHVFILSRVREAFDRGMTTDDAVAHGIKSTAGVVTSAAVVMVGVFAIFATLSSFEFKQMGVGLAVAVLIDATLVRGVLLPASMKLLGDWNWYLPRWLEWLPRASHEPAAPPSGRSLNRPDGDGQAVRSGARPPARGRASPVPGSLSAPGGPSRQLTVPGHGRSTDQPERESGVNILPPLTGTKLTTVRPDGRR